MAAKDPDGQPYVRSLTYKVPVEFIQENMVLFIRTEDLIEGKKRINAYLKDQLRRNNPFFIELRKTEPVKLDLTDAARAWLGRVGYDPVYGARPLKRAVQRYLQDPLADLILRGEVPDGSTVKIDEGDGALKMSVA